MNKYFLLIVVFAYILPSRAQIRPGGSGLPTAGPVAIFGKYDADTINYIRTWEPSMPATDPAAIAASTDVKAVRQTTQYFDGLGRPLQTVSKNISPLGKDLVTAQIYDEFGREQFKYLPYVPQSGNTGDGKFKLDPFNAQMAFFRNAALNPGIGGDSIYYSQEDYEASPLNRLVKVYAPGNSWAKEGGNKPVEQQYLVNIAADSVRIWELPASGVIPTSTGAYAAGALTKSVSKDERGLRTIEFRDKQERVVLRKAELAVGTADGHTGWLCTYYVYDDLGNMRCIIPPKALGLVSGSWIIDNTVANELCFFYRYDNQNHLIVKKNPGTDSTEMVYDIRDRVAFMRDGELKSDSMWLVTFYDGLNRPTMEALYRSGASRVALQTSMNNSVLNTQSISYTKPGTTDLVIAYHDGRPIYAATNSIAFENGFDSGNGETDTEISSTVGQETMVIPANNPLPNIPAGALTPILYTFYDDYSYTGKHGALTSDFQKPQYIGSPYAEVVNTISNMTRGLVTGSRVRVLGTDQWLTTTSYYTDKGRVLQTISDNIGGGKDVTTSLYDFSGKLLSTYLRHTNLRSGTLPQDTILTQMLYDAAGRITQVFKQINGGPKRTIAQNVYNEFGQLQNKRLGLKTTDNKFLDSLQYEYHVRGWVKGINKGYVNSSGSAANWFGQELSYDNGFIENQLNGNIAGVKWKSRSDSVPRAYGYRYDGANRLILADFTQQNTPGALWTRDKMDFSVSNLLYDANGNISSMAQKGMNGTAIINMDQLTYTYQANSNQLAAVADAGTSTAASKLGDFLNGANTGDDYAYDLNGNLTKDLNKSIASITYNHLNLPELITVTGKGSIRYQYDAKGTKLRKVVTENISSATKVTTTDYISGLVYRNDTLELISHEEGRIRPVFKTGQPVAFYYDFFEKDHLGNVRAVLTEQTDLSMYTATMEAASATKEAALFSNVDETRTTKPVGYPEDNSAGKNEYVAKLNAKDGGKKIGPSLVLRVMAGDTIRIGARAFYKSTGPRDSKNVTPENMIAGLIQAFGGKDAGDASHGVSQGNYVSPFGNLTAGDYQRLKEKDMDGTQQDKPKAYLNFVLFDDQFNLVESNSGVRQVKGVPDELQTLAVDKMPITKSGFLYVYTSNEAQQDVFFDNVTVTAATGPLLEETHYYPFGLTIAAISSKAIKGANYAENRKKYNGNELQSGEFADGSGLELYDFNARTYNQQIGRFLQIDPRADEGSQEALSPYHFSGNNPVRYNDPDGDCPWCAVIGAAVEGGVELAGQLASGKSLSEVDWVDVGVEAAKGALTASGAGVLLRVALDVGGEVVKAGADYSQKDGLKTVANGKSMASAGVDFGVGLIGNYAGGAVADGVAKSAGNAVKTTSNKAYQAAKVLTKAENKTAKTIAKTGGYGAKAMAAKQAVNAAAVDAQKANLKHAAAKVANTVAPNATKTAANAVENKSQDKVKDWFKISPVNPQD